MIGESMNHAGIDEGLHFGLPAMAGKISLQQFRRRGVVEFAEMQDQRARYGLALAGEEMDARAVIADRGVGAVREAAR